MRLNMYLMAFMVFGSVAVSAQNTKLSIQERMKELSWLTGEWKGEGWMIRGKEGKKTFQQQETITPLLDGTIVSIKGLGLTGADTVHRAYSIVYWDLLTESLKMIAFTAEGLSTIADVSIDHEQLTWKMDVGNGRTITYVIGMNGKRQWVEKGSMETAPGRPPYQFFEMTLTRK